MKAKPVKKVKVTLSNRRPWGRPDDDIKEKVVSEVRSGLLSKRTAGRNMAYLKALYVIRG